MRLEQRETKDPLWINDPVYGIEMLAPREGLFRGADPPNDDRPVLTNEQLVILRSIAIAAATLSICSGVLVGWWFVRMKRSFRHHLIMFLIFSDFFKASWQLIYPAVVFSRGAVTSGSRFCQISGFMMSMGIEASDFAVLTIAVHSALYIFRPGMGGIGEGGLYRYRYYLYIAWLAFAIVMPSLAFVNDSPAYSAQGTYCYLPVRPFWYRLALAWIPRYIILTTILILYASIYIYVRMKFRTFRTSVGVDALDLDSIDLAQQPAEAPLEPTRLPSLDAHGLIPPSPALQPKDPSRNSDIIPFARAFLTPLIDKIHSSASSDSANSRRGSVPTIAENDTRTAPDTSMADKEKQLIRGTAAEELRRRRIAISRQLRLLFIYPLVYALMWVPSLVSHALQFTDHFANNPSFPLQCVVAFTLPFQCAVDCWLFTIREKPWTYIPETYNSHWWARYGFWGSESKGKSTDVGAEEGGDSAWRHRKHMSYEARKAYERREDERKEAAEAAVNGSENPIRMPLQRSERSWWDVEQMGLSVDDEDLDADPEESSVNAPGRSSARGTIRSTSSATFAPDAGAVMETTNSGFSPSRSSASLPSRPPSTYSPGTRSPRSSSPIPPP